MTVIAQFIEHQVCAIRALSTALSSLHVLTNCVLTSPQWGSYHYPHFTNEDMEALRWVSSLSKITQQTNSKYESRYSVLKYYSALHKKTYHLLQIELHPPKCYVEVLTLGTYACDFIWKQGLCRCNWVKVRLYQIRVVPNTIWLLSLKEENLDIEGGQPWEDRDRDWSYTTTSQGTLGATRS